LRQYAISLLSYFAIGLSGGPLPALCAALKKIFTTPEVNERVFEILESPAEVSFTLNISGFQVTTDDFGSLKSTEVDFGSFNHKYPSSGLKFTNSDGVVWAFNTGSVPIDSFTSLYLLGYILFLVQGVHQIYLEVTQWH